MLNWKFGLSEVVRMVEIFCFSEGGENRGDAGGDIGFVRGRGEQV